VHVFKIVVVRIITDDDIGVGNDVFQKHSLSICGSGKTVVGSGPCCICFEWYRCHLISLPRR
jgi:hypothetical protein